ncbi:hypothetical protein CERSUDRAFT_112032 [Gelatoporia subvermispora B]|uniref:HRDC domain-containing protein n=1 Tax=Ceriporiopsis subvermispora (strain B) TaxID=914234 RepID=M2R573_CERS8|nr:hypothetical protein CERSUDRAFT_112032 [Gelatoporia subvermispora B]
MAPPASLTPAGFNDYNAALQGAALTATRHAAAFPADLAFHRSMDRPLARALDAASARVLALTNRLVGLAHTAQASGKGKGKEKIESEDDVVDRFHSLVVDAMDQLLERADICLDEVTGRTKAPAIAVNPAQTAAQKTRKPNAPPGRLDPALQHAAHLAKPQLQFARKPDNNSNTIWTPTLRHKYNAQVPLGYNYRSDDGHDEGSASLHPYRYEITHTDYPARMFRTASPVAPRGFADTQFTWVADRAAFDEMLAHLRTAQEIALDLEHHSFRSFGGFVCLMQISTRERDFIVDVLQVREEMEELNEVLTDPRIVKVLHGAESDIVWLQQDFNLYVVNLFDTYHASKVLEFPRHNLGTLLEMYCDFTPDKRYQLADWRIRPLPEEMLQYARSDTHFLLYIYDNLRNALLDRAQSRAQSPSASASTPPSPAGADTDPAHALVREVLARSATTALRVYEKERYDPDQGLGPGGWDTLARKWNKGALVAPPVHGADSAVARTQRAVYRAVHAWRDRVSRAEDESTRYVLPNHALFALAERTPADMAALLALFRPVPPVVRRRAQELLDTVRAAVKEALGGPVEVPATEVVETEKVDSDVREEVDTEAVEVEATPANKDASLWTKVSRPTDATRPTSTLFGASLAAPVGGTRPHAAKESALFGGAVLNAQGSRAAQKRFGEVVARIHGTLIIAPSVPKLPVAAVELVDSAGPAEIGPGAPGSEARDDVMAVVEELAFVPAAQRQRQAAVREEEADTIVVVGQAKPRKRKRKAQQGAEDAEEREEGASGEGAPEFDYGAVSNILDDGSDDERVEVGRKKKKKQKQSKDAVYTYGNFGAPPKAHSQLKKGNQARTFR